MMIGSIAGSVTLQVCFQRFAPSIEAASYNVGSTFVIAARKTIVLNPTFFHISEPTSTYGKMGALFKKRIGSIPKTPKNWLTMPSDDSNWNKIPPKYNPRKEIWSVNNDLNEPFVPFFHYFI